MDFASLKIPKSKKKSASLPKRKKCKVMNLACRLARRFKTFRYGLAQTFLETAPSSSSFSDEYMNLALTAKEKQLLRSRKCGHSRWILLAAIHRRFGFFNPYP
jgi:hypothetical protein